jgi:hypothetical protein
MVIFFLISISVLSFNLILDKKLDMKKIYLLTFLTILNYSLKGQIENGPILYKGTIVKAIIKQTVNTKTNFTGEIVRFELAEDILKDSTVVIEKGSKIFGTIIKSKKAKLAGTNGSLDFTIDYLQLPNGRNLPLVSTNEMRVKEDKQIGVIAATALVHPLFLLIKGKDVFIEEGKIFEVYLGEDF